MFKTLRSLIGYESESRSENDIIFTPNRVTITGVENNAIIIRIVLSLSARIYGMS
jgi:hypothetical protein